MMTLVITLQNGTVHLHTQGDAPTEDALYFCILAIWDYAKQVPGTTPVQLMRRVLTGRKADHEPH